MRLDEQRELAQTSHKYPTIINGRHARFSALNLLDLTGMMRRQGFVPTRWTRRRIEKRQRVRSTVLTVHFVFHMGFIALSYDGNALMRYPLQYW